MVAAADDTAAPSPGEAAVGAGTLEPADGLLEVAAADPKRALVLARDLLEGGGLGPRQEAVAERAAALAELGLGRVLEARRRFERARTLALEAGLVDTAAQIRIGLAVVLLQCEEPDVAMAEVDAAMASATDATTLAQVQAQRATILMRLCRYPEALEQATIALASCRQAGLDGPVARLLSNLGVVHAYLGDYIAAERQLFEALHLLRQRGSALGAANVVHNLGFVAARRGDFPAALRHFDDAVSEHTRLGVPSHAALTDRCEALLSVRLLPEARLAAAEAVAGLEEAGQAADLAEARLMHAEVCLATGDLATARRSAGEAAEAFGRQGRLGWAALGRFLSAKAGWSEGASPVCVVAAEAEKMGRELAAAGWRLHALEARILSAIAWLDAGRAAEARRVLAATDAPSPLGGAASSDERVRSWYARALYHLAAGDGNEALGALERGLSIADEHRAALGATELRARATLRSAELADLGLRIVISRGSAPAVLEWSERGRARSLSSPGALPPRDPVLAGHLAQLRHTVAALEGAAEAGEEAPEMQQLAQRRRRLETAIRQRSMQAGRRRWPFPAAPRYDEVQEFLDRGDVGAVVEMVSVGDQIHAVVCSAGACVIRPLESVAPLRRLQAALRFALGRLAGGRGSRVSLLAAADLLQRSAVEADRLLFGPLVADMESALAGAAPGLVVVPTTPLHSLPWALLPSLHGRPLSLSPSLGLLMSRSQGVPVGARPNAKSVLVAAPGVPFAGEEIDALHHLYPQAVCLRGAAARASVVAEALSGAGVAHVAAHGRFRADNALFSALDLADGPLTVYELEEVGDPPELLVLSCCDAGRVDAQPGDELMGTAAAMLALGSRTIVASVAPVPDAGAPAVMRALHARLAAGEPPAAALAGVQAAHDVAAFDPEQLAEGSLAVKEALAAAGFVCLGAGSSPAGGPVAWPDAAR